MEVENMMTKENMCEYIDKAYKNLNEKYSDKLLQDIPSLSSSLCRDDNLNNVQSVVNKLQAINNVLYSKYGDEDNIIIFQARINQIRNLYDIVDKSEIIHIQPDGEFVQ
jgi:hypothetical protein